MHKMNSQVLRINNAVQTYKALPKLCFKASGLKINQDMMYCKVGDYHVPSSHNNFFFSETAHIEKKLVTCTRLPHHQQPNQKLLLYVATTHLNISAFFKYRDDTWNKPTGCTCTGTTAYVVLNVVQLTWYIQTFLHFCT